MKAMTARQKDVYAQLQAVAKTDDPKLIGTTLELSAGRALAKRGLAVVVPPHSIAPTPEAVAFRRAVAEQRANNQKEKAA